MRLDHTGLQTRINDISVKETKNSFVSERMRISKTKLLTVDTKWVENHKYIIYHTYCLPEQVGEAKTTLYEHIKKVIHAYKEEIDQLFDIFQQTTQ